MGGVESQHIKAHMHVIDAKHTHTHTQFYLYDYYRHNTLPNSVWGPAKWPQFASRMSIVVLNLQ